MTVKKKYADMPSMKRGCLGLFILLIGLGMCRLDQENGGYFWGFVSIFWLNRLLFDDHVESKSEIEKKCLQDIWISVFLLSAGMSLFHLIVGIGLDIEWTTSLIWKGMNLIMAGLMVVNGMMMVLIEWVDFEEINP